MTAHLVLQIPGCLTRLDIDVDGIELPTGVQVIAQSQQAGGLTGLARGMEHKIFPLVNQRFQLFQIDTCQRIDIVMNIRLDGTGRIEKFRYACHSSAFVFDNLCKDTNIHPLYK